jgi:hypothetical protein
MKKQAVIATPPQQVWQTLTVTQQQVVQKAIVRVCHHLTTYQKQEEANETNSHNPVGVPSQSDDRPS